MLSRPPLDRIAFLGISWYSLFIVTGVVLGILLATREEKRLGLPKDTTIDFAILAIPLALVGARLYYVLFQWDSFSEDLLSIFDIRSGGLAIYGGVLGGLLAAWLVSKRKQIALSSILDIVAPSLVLGQAIGRWGNYFNQELYGAVVDNVSGQIFSDLALFPPAVKIGSEWHVALFLIESVWNLITFFVLLYIWKKKPHMRGVAFWTYCTMYCSARAILEGMRLPEYSLMVFGTIRVSQAVSAVMAVASIAMLVYVYRKGGYKGPEVPERYRIAKQEDE